MKRIGILLAAALIAASAYLLGWSNFLTVKKIVINESDVSIAKEISERIQISPKVIEVGWPIARVDKRAIASRLREIIWVSDVEVRRHIINGEVEISVSSRKAIARVNQYRSLPADQIAFLGSNLEIFTIPSKDFDSAARSGDADWRELPTVKLGDESLELRADVATLMNFLAGKDFKTESIAALNAENLKSKVRIGERELDIYWGNVKDLELKERVLAKLLELKANKRVRNIDLTSPLSPVVS